MNSCLLFPPVVKTAAMSCLLSATYGGVLLQDLVSDVYVSLSHKPLVSLSLSLSLGSFFSLKAGQLQGFQTYRVQYNTCRWFTSHCVSHGRVKISKLSHISPYKGNNLIIGIPPS